MKILPNVVYLSPASSILALLGVPMALYCALTIGSSTPEACETPETEKHRQARDGSSPPERSDGHSRAEPELALADDARVFRNLAAGRLEVGGKRACGWLGSGGASTAVTADPPRMMSRPLASCSCSLLHSTRSTCASSALLAGGPPLLRAHGRGRLSCSSSSSSSVAQCMLPFSALYRPDRYRSSAQWQLRLQQRCGLAAEGRAT